MKLKKITSNTYANEVTYENEEFILLSISILSAGTVSVTYGGITKTIVNRAASARTHIVYFGTYHGVSDEVETPASGTLTIEGELSWFGVTSYNVAKGSTQYCNCITAVNDFGSVTAIANSAFKNCTDITSINIPNSVTSIGNYAFEGCTNLANIVISDNVTHIPSNMFSGCTGLTSIIIPSGVRTIDIEAFNGCTNLMSIAIPDNVRGISQKAFVGCTNLNNVYFENTRGWEVYINPDYIKVDVADPETNASMLTSEYVQYPFIRIEEVN